MSQLELQLEGPSGAPREAETVLETENLVKNFGGVAANQGITIRVPARTFTTVIGPNGAGKTTLFNLISGVLRPTSGRVRFRGEDITGLPPHLVARRGLARSFQITNIFPNLSVFENLRLAAQAQGRDSFRLLTRADGEAFRRYQNTAARVAEEVGLTARLATPAGMLPHGDKRKLEIGILLAAEPAMMLLDEPTAGMAREEIPGIIALLERIRAAGSCTIMMVEHKMDVVMNVSDVIMVLKEGRLIAQGAPAEVAADPVVQEAYLGGGLSRAE